MLESAVSARAPRAPTAGPAAPGSISGHTHITVNFINSIQHFRLSADISPESELGMRVGKLLNKARESHINVLQALVTLFDFNQDQVVAYMSSPQLDMPSEEPGTQVTAPAVEPAREAPAQTFHFAQGVVPGILIPLAQPNNRGL